MVKSAVNNTQLSADELSHFKKKLLSLQGDTEELISSLKERLEELNRNKADTQSAQDHHQGDIATLETDKKTILQSIEQNQKKLEKIAVALDRIEIGNYGICIESGQKIEKGRLEAIPYAVRTVGIKS